MRNPSIVGIVFTDGEDRGLPCLTTALTLTHDGCTGLLLPKLWMRSMIIGRHDEVDTGKAALR